MFQRAETVQPAGSAPRSPLQALVPILAREYTPLMYAAYAKNLTVAQLLVARGAAVNAAGANHTTPLMIAAQQADAPMVKWLLAQGADAKRKNAFDYTALLFAVAPERTDAALVKTLLASGADLNAPGKDGETARHNQAKLPPSDKPSKKACRCSNAFAYRFSNRPAVFRVIRIRCPR